MYQKGKAKATWVQSANWRGAVLPAGSPIPSLPLFNLVVTFLVAARSYRETSPRRPAAVCGLPNYSALRFSHSVASFLFMEEGLLVISVIIIIINTSEVAPPRNAGNWWGRTWVGSVCSFKYCDQGAGFLLWRQFWSGLWSFILFLAHHSLELSFIQPLFAHLEDPSQQPWLMTSYLPW